MTSNEKIRKLHAMLVRFESQSDLEDAMHKLVQQDPRLNSIIALTGMPALRQREPGFEGLAHIVCGQQLSSASASAIWTRLSAAFDPFDHHAIRKARSDKLGRLGLSRLGRCETHGRHDQGGRMSQSAAASRSLRGEHVDRFRAL